MFLDLSLFLHHCVVLFVIFVVFPFLFFPLVLCLLRKSIHSSQKYNLVPRARVLFWPAQRNGALG